MAQGFEQQQGKRAPFALVGGLRRNLVQDEPGERTGREQVPIAPHPFERVPPVGFAAYGEPVFFNVVNSQRLITMIT